jgi:hypothetical protein
MLYIMCFMMEWCYFLLLIRPLSNSLLAVSASLHLCSVILILEAEKPLLQFVHP